MESKQLKTIPVIKKTKFNISPTQKYYSKFINTDQIRKKK